MWKLTQTIFKTITIQSNQIHRHNACENYCACAYVWDVQWAQRVARRDASRRTDASASHVQELQSVDVMFNHRTSYLLVVSTTPGRLIPAPQDTPLTSWLSLCCAACPAVSDRYALVRMNNSIDKSDALERPLMPEPCSVQVIHCGFRPSEPIFTRALYQVRMAADGSTKATSMRAMNPSANRQYSVPSTRGPTVSLASASLLSNRRTEVHRSVTTKSAATDAPEAGVEEFVYEAQVRIARRHGSCWFGRVGSIGLPHNAETLQPTETAEPEQPPLFRCS